MDKQALLEAVGIESVRNNIINNTAISLPNTLLSFVLLIFADLKQYRFTYWLGVPAILPNTPFIYTQPSRLVSTGTESLKHTLMFLKEMVRDRERMASLEDKDHKEWIETETLSSASMVDMVEVDNIGRRMVLQIYRHLQRTLSDSTLRSQMQCMFALRLDSGDEYSTERTTVMSLRDAWPMRCGLCTFIVCFDRASAQSALGWPVRNLLAMLASHAGEHSESVRIIALRGKLARKIAR